MARAERVPSDWDAVEPGGDGACLDEPADQTGPDTFGGDGAGSKDAREECTESCEADLEPGVEGTDGITLAALPADDSDELPVAVLICLGATYGHEDASGLGDDVGDVQGGELAGPQGRGVAGAG